MNATPTVNQVIWYQNQMMASPINSPERQEWIRIKREVEAQRLSQIMTDKFVCPACGVWGIYIPKSQRMVCECPDSPTPASAELIKFYT